MVELAVLAQAVLFTNTAMRHSRVQKLCLSSANAQWVVLRAHWMAGIAYRLDLRCVTEAPYGSKQVRYLQRRAVKGRRAEADRTHSVAPAAQQAASNVVEPRRSGRKPAKTRTWKRLLTAKVAAKKYTIKITWSYQWYDAMLLWFRCKYCYWAWKSLTSYHLYFQNRALSRNDHSRELDGQHSILHTGNALLDLLV